MEFDKVIRERCSVRRFSDREISKEVIDKILEAGRIAPTAKNIQPFKIYFVSSEEGISKIDKASRCRYGAPVVFIICGDKDASYNGGNHSFYEIDTSIVTTHMMLEAYNVGVDSVWVGLFDGDILRSEFSIPDNLVPVALLPLGYRSDDCPDSPWHSKRKEVSELVEYR